MAEQDLVFSERIRWYGDGTTHVEFTCASCGWSTGRQLREMPDEQALGEAREQVRVLMRRHGCRHSVPPSPEPMRPPLAPEISDWWRSQYLEDPLLYAAARSGLSAEDTIEHLFKAYCEMRRTAEMALSVRGPVVVPIQPAPGARRGGD